MMEEIMIFWAVIGVPWLVAELFFYWDRYKLRDQIPYRY